MKSWLNWKWTNQYEGNLKDHFKSYISWGKLHQLSHLNPGVRPQL